MTVIQNPEPAACPERASAVSESSGQGDRGRVAEAPFELPCHPGWFGEAPAAGGVAHHDSFVVLEVHNGRDVGSASAQGKDLHPAVAGNCRRRVRGPQVDSQGASDPSIPPVEREAYNGGAVAGKVKTPRFVTSISPWT